MMAVRKDIENDYQHWAKKLELLRQESALLKYRLSDMVDSDDENLFLQKAEYFQNELLLKDEMLKKLIQEVQLYKDLMENKLHLSKKIHALHDKLQKDILNFEKQFVILSNAFNEQMLQNS
ncbi:MAG: hypothetical protein ACTHK0_01680 [Ginsengibacter sp.]